MNINDKLINKLGFLKACILMGILSKIEDDYPINIIDELICDGLILDESQITEKAYILIYGNSKIDFDEFWNSFPTNTPSGRPLKAKSKEFHGRLTKDYEICRVKYLNAVKSQELHNDIVKIIKARVLAKDYEFINNMETYINKRAWEKDTNYLYNNSIRNTTNK